MKINGNLSKVRFNPFHNMRYNAYGRRGRGFSIRSRASGNGAQTTEHVWLIPSELYTPFNLRTTNNHDGSRTYTFTDAAGIIRVDRSFFNEGMYGQLNGVGRNQQIHRVILDSGNRGQLLWSLVGDTLTDEDYAERYMELPIHWIVHNNKVDRASLNDCIGQFGLLEKLFSMEDNSLALNTAIRLGIENPILFINGQKIFETSPIYIHDDAVITLKFKDGSFVNTVLERLDSGMTHNGVDLGGLIKVNDEWTKLFVNITPMREFNKEHPLYNEVEWFADLSLSGGSVGVTVYHFTDDKEEILKIFEPHALHEVRVTIDSDFQPGDDGVKTLNRMIASGLEVDKINVIYINGVVQGVDTTWDGNLDELYDGLDKYCGAIGELDDELYQLVTGETKSKHLIGSSDDRSF